MRLTLLILIASFAALAPAGGPALAAGPVSASDFPSGRTTYRTLVEYNAEMRQLAAENPGLVRVFALPHRTWEGREVLGIEVTENVGLRDGKPVFLNLGLHHGRDWPSGEHAIEWAIELIDGFKAGNARASNIVRNSRNIVVPVVSPDSFHASRAAGAAAGADGGRDEAGDDLQYFVLGAGNEYKHKNCRLADNSEAGSCSTSAGENGVDPDRNYGFMWGGPGAEPTNPLIQTYRGPGPFSEPETRNIQSLVSANQVVTLISNQTSGGMILRAPGLRALAETVDEDRGYKALADAMARENGYFSKKGFERFDATGTAEDWSYHATGAYSFAFDIYCGAPDYELRDCGDPALHPRYETIVDEWTGDNPQAAHTGDPGPDAGYAGKGNREAYYLAAESTLNEARHSVLEGSGPAGATLRLTRSFRTETFPRSPGPILIDERLESVYDVGPDGRVRWHVNPSTRPIAAKATGVTDPGEASPPETRSGSTAGASDDPNNDGASPEPDAGSNDSSHYNDHPITVPVTGDNATMSARVSWTSMASDWDLRLYEDLNGDGISQDDEPIVSLSRGRPSNVEEVSVSGQPRLTPGKKYVLRVNNYGASEGYELDIAYEPPLPFRPAQAESYTLTCEKDGRVYDTQQVAVERGQVRQLDLGPCARAIDAANQVSTPAGAPSCAAAALSNVRVRVAGRRLLFGFSSRAPRGVTVELLQAARGRRVTKQRRVARFRNKKRSFGWSWRSRRPRLRPGHFVARYTATSPSGRREVRRKALLLGRRGFSSRRDFDRPDGCGLLRSYGLDSPAFGGSSRRPLKASFRLADAANVSIVARRGKRTRTMVRSRRFTAGRLHRVGLSPRGLPGGDYKVQIRVTRPGTRTVTSTLTSRKL